MICRYAIVLVNLDPATGAEIRKTRPCLVISPDEMNRRLHTLTVAPMTSKGFPAAFRVEITFKGVSGKVLLDQMRTIDKSRVVKVLGKAPEHTADAIRAVLLEMFA